MKVADEIPKFLLNDYNEKEKMAMEWRKRNRAGRTRTKIVDQEIVLFGRKEHELKFQPI